MPQLVGNSCVICGKRISSALEGEFCDACGNPLHGRCLKGFQPQEAADASRCARCGGRPENAPVEKSARPMFKPEYWLYGAIPAAIVLVIVAFLMRPGDGDSRRDPADNPQVQNATNPIVEIETTMGTIRAELFADRAPNTVKNFVDLVQQGFYDGILFHRVIREFMIQTGDPLGAGTGGRTDKGLPAQYLADEFHPGLRHDKPGVLSMANSGPNTGDTQFFITTVPTPWLNDKHAIFGQVIEGMDVVRKIEKVPTGAGDRPLSDVKMVRVQLVSGREESAL